MADITSKAAMAPAAPKAADGKSASDGGHSLGFSSLPSSIHHGLSEKLQGFTEKLQQLGQKTSGEGSELASNRSRTSSWGTGAHPSLAVKEVQATNAQCQSPSRTCSRTSSKKSNQSTLISNGKVSEGIFEMQFLEIKSHFDRNLNFDKTLILEMFHFYRQK